ncbi:MAG: hypothetical protein PF693_19540 [Spirochaetia bacterium]|jgi:hypothetical protein|nr:hypothetical protein [Spirochaetia bacterium]
MRDLIKKKTIYLLILVIFFSCTSNSGENSDQDRSEQNFRIPELIQQEIPADDLGDLKEYSSYISIIEKGSVIPGILQGAVPQGMAYYSEKDLMLISNYMFDGRPSCITIIDMADGLLQKTFWLLNPDGTVHMGHVGGLAVSKKYLWIASGTGVYYVSLETFENQSDNTSLKMTAFVQTAAKGSFATYSDGILWIGEFTSRDGSYSVPDFHHFKTNDGKVNHGWMAGFTLDRESDLIVKKNIIADISEPDYILSVPHEVQGSVFIDGKIVLSQSYGRKNNSRISVYSDVRNEPPHNSVTIGAGGSIPVWILDSGNLEAEIISPPMTEGIVEYRGSAAVLYESGSDKYRSTAKTPQDRIHILTLNTDD